METFPVFQAAQRGLIDQDTCYVLLETQLITGGLLHPDSSLQFTLEEGLNRGLVDTNARHSLSRLENALLVVKNLESCEGQQQNTLPVSTAMECGLITEEEGLRILELQMNTGGLRTFTGLMMNLKEAEKKGLLRPLALAKLQKKMQHKELVDPNTAEQLNLYELRQRCVSDSESGLLLLPVQQQPRGNVCVAQEGSIDRKVAVRLLEAQMFAGGIVDPRSGHRLNIKEAVDYGLMDQDLACALLARQLQNGGILDPFSKERLELEESIYRDLLPSHMAPVVLEYLGAFAGILWPESGEMIPIVEALQQGVISGELSRNILRHRHVIGALYNPETLQLLPLTEAAEQYLDPSVVIFLKDTHIPDVISSRNPSVTPNSSSRDSTFSTPHSSFSEDAVTSAHFDDPEEELEHRLLVHLIAHSYVDAHSGKRLLLLDPELNEMVQANILVSKDAPDAKQVSSQSTSSTYEQGDLKILEQPNLTVQELTDQQQAEADQIDSIKFSANKEFEKNDTGTLEENNKSFYNQSATVEIDIPVRGAKDSKTENDAGAESLTSLKKLEESKLNSSCGDGGRKTEENFSLLKDPIYQEAKTDGGKEAIPITPPSNIFESTVVKDSQDMELEKLSQELKHEGLLNLDGNKLLPDEAVAQGLLSGYTAVKLMAEANLFGGFVDSSSGESLTLDDVTQGLGDEDLMWSVLKSDKTLSGVVDVDNNHVCSIREASQTGLIDPNTAARLLEAQVVSGGIVDLRQNEKVSVATAANLGLIEENQKDELMVLESAYKGKNVDAAIALTKASLQLQMDGVIDPESKSPVPLEQAIQNKLIKPDEAYQVLTKQVAEGGIVHHASGLRLSVSEAVDRGLVNRSIASGLQELEWIFKGKLNPSSHPEALPLQASTGAIFDPESGCKLTLTEAVSKGLLDDSVADEAMISSVMTQGVLDPQSARIVPFSELVQQGKVDIKTGQRFLAVTPFRGIQNDETGDKMTLPEAVASKKVDPIPSFRLLESQANSGGIVDVTTGERLPLSEACKRGLIDDKHVSLITTSQFLKGGIVDPVSGKQVSDLDDAVDKGLISSQTALDILENTVSAEVEDDGSSNTVIKEIIPELCIKKAEAIPEKIQEKKVQVETRKTDPGKSVQAHTDKDSLKATTTAIVDKKEHPPSDESKISMCHEPDDRNVCVLAEEIGDEVERKDAFVEERAMRKGDMAGGDDDKNAKEKPAEMEIKISTDDKLPDQQQTFPLNTVQSKNKKRGKKNRKDKEAQLNKKDHSSQIDQVEQSTEGQSNGAFTDDQNSSNKSKTSHIYSQVANTLTSNQDDTIIDGNNLVKQGLKADPAAVKYTEHSSESQRDQDQAALAKNTDKGEKSVELKKEKKKDDTEETPSVSQQTERPQTSQDVKKIKEIDLPQKRDLPDDEKDPLILKATESILKKVFEKGVSGKQTDNELQTLSIEVENERPAVKEVELETLSSEPNVEGNHIDKDDSGRKDHRSSQFTNGETSKESKLEPAVIKADAAVEMSSEKTGTETIPLKTSDEKEKSSPPKEDTQENIETAQPALSKEKNKESLNKQSKKNKSKSSKARGAGQKKLSPPENADLDVAKVSTNSVAEKTDMEKSVIKTDDQPASDVMKPSLVDDVDKAINARTNLSSPSDLQKPEESTSQMKGQQKLSGATSTGQEQFDESEKSTDFSQDVLKSHIQPTAQSMEFGAHSNKVTEEDKKIQQQSQGTNVPELKSIKDQNQNSETSESAEDISLEYGSTNPECATDTDILEEDDVTESDDMDNTRTASRIRKVSCLLIMYGLHSFCM